MNQALVKTLVAISLAVNAPTGSAPQTTRDPGAEKSQEKTGPVVVGSISSVELDDKESDGGGISGGVVSVIRDGEEHEAQAHSLIYLGEKIVTEPGESATLALSDGSRITLGPSSELAIEQIQNIGESPSSVLNLTYGILRSRVKKLYVSKHPFVVKTPDAVFGARGTDFIAEYRSDGASEVHTLEGVLEMAHSTEDLQSGHGIAFVPSGKVEEWRPEMTSNPKPKSFDKAEFFAALQERSKGFRRALDAPAPAAKKTDKKTVKKAFRRPAKK